MEKDELGDEGCKLLQAKLQAIEEWAFKVFHVEIHFFLVDLPSVRENSFGGSDQESSGSAQGKILKEEFYRTMLFVAGKIPLWCATPQWLNDNLVELAPRLYKDYVDMGTISSIPKGEYFGASIWQIFKSLKSPYKSVIKMSLLDKYIQEEGRSVLLCDRLKSGWSLGRSDLMSFDPYILLFEEVLEYCQRTEQKDPESLLKICFFLKLGIWSISALDNLVIKVRKKVVQGYIDAWGWDEKRVQDLGRFKEWNFDKIFQLSSKINHYMIETYKRSSRALKDTEDQDTIITQRDLTILGRKMFVQFSRQPHKVEKLPLVASGKSLFQRLELQYSQPYGENATWSLYHPKTTIEKKGNNYQLLKKTAQIEEIAIWLVHNGLYSSTTSIELMSNPTPISIQDFLDLLKSLLRVFPSAEADPIAPEALLKNAQPRKLLIAVNFNLDRNLKRIHEYTVFYTTSWGELFCKFFRDKQGDASLKDALKKVEKQLELKVSSSQVSFFIPQEARKRFNPGIIL